MSADGDRLRRGTGAEPGRYLTAFPLAERTVLHVLQARAADAPDGTWVVFDGVERLTFAQAWRAARRAASAVRATAGEGGHVALLLRNQPEFLVALYGTMAAGGVGVPLNADARGPLLADVLGRSHARVLVVRADLLDVVGRLGGLGSVGLVVVAGEGPVPTTVGGVPAIGWDAWLAAGDDGVDGTGDGLPGFGGTAVIMYTSGTTGRQKGAVIPHHFFYLYSAALADSLGRTADDVLSTPLPLYHAAALHMVTGAALHAGCTAHLKSRFSASRYLHELAADGATFSIIFGPMAAMVDKRHEGEVPAHRLRQLFCVPPPPERERFERRFGVTCLWQGYGMTEVYPLPMRPENLPGASPDTVGYPATWFEYGVVDAHDRVLPAGEVGELVWRPRWPYAMAGGYYDDAEATVAAFRNLAFHTGDLATVDEDGLVHYRGRRRDRIRHRGENVNAVEVEFVALTHPDVLEAAAYGVDADIGEQDVKLDVVLTRDLDLAALHDWLTDHLPRYMIPRYLERRDSFPKTPSERVEKWKLSTESLDRAAVLDVGDRKVVRRG